MIITYTFRGKNSKTKFRSIKNHKKVMLNTKEEHKKICDYFNLKNIIIILFAVLACTAIICCSVLFTMNKKIKVETFNESNFTINTEINTLSQYSMKSSQIHYSISNLMNSTFSLIHNAKYDIYTINESLPEKETDLYSKLYKTAIIINSQCFEFEKTKKNCELKKYLDLTIKNQNNLRRTNENIEEIKEAILPICIIEHSDTNIILSITCPETLSENLKNNIISTFKSIKPNLSRENFQNYSLSGLSINITSNEIEANMYDRRCNYMNNSGNENCEIIQNMTTDRNRNLLKSVKHSKFEKIQDKNNKYYNNLNFTFENIINESNLNKDNFKYNLNIILNLIKPLMKKEDFKVYNSINNKNNESDYSINRRKLEDKNYIGYIQEKYFSKSFFGINLELNSINDFGFGKDENSKIISEIKRGEKMDEISRDDIFTNIYYIIKEFKILSKSSNKLANSLYEKYNEIFSNLIKEINSNISSLNNLLVYNDISSIFDSNIAINELKELPNSFISTCYYLYSNITKFNQSIGNSILNIKNKLRDNIQTFIEESHNFIEIISNNISEFIDMLSSNKSKITEISTYYLQYKDSSYENIIKKAILIFENYNINEKNIIDTLLNDIFTDFSKNFFETMNKIQSLLDNVINNLNRKNLYIKSGSNRNINNVIYYLSNTKYIINQIISNIPLILKNSIGIKDNGYFESQGELEVNKEKNKIIANKAINITYTLDNNIFIDTTFDNIMKDFKNNFVNILNYIEKSKKEKFPLKNNMFLNSSFIIDLFDKMEQDFNDEKIQILIYIKNENNYYLDSIEKETISFTEKYKRLLDNLINDIDIQLSEINLFNLNSKYDEILNLTFNSINNLIENNKILAVEYLTNVKNKGSSHCTQLFKNKAKKFFDTFTEIKNYIKLNLKDDLINLYEKTLNNVKNNLNIVKLNPVIEKYMFKLPFTEEHLRMAAILFLRFDKYFSNQIFNETNLPLIDNYINETYNYLNQIETTLNNLYKPVLNLPYSSSNSYDYYLLRVYCYTYCADKILGICLNHKTECINLYDGYKSAGSDNYLNLIYINFTEYSKEFDRLFNDIDGKVSNDTLVYKTTLNIYQNNLNLIKKEILDNTKDYLYNISKIINYFRNEDLCDNITILDYNYFSEEIKNKLIFESDYILFQWKNIFNHLIQNINLNIDKYKYSIQELGILGEQYYKIYSQNISKDFINSIIEQRKNDFNYTLKYYYNMLLSKVNKTYTYILSNMPINDEVFNDILNIRKNEIQESYNNMIDSINNTKNKYLEVDTQMNIIEVNETSFLMNSKIEKNYDYSQNQIYLKYKELLKNIEKVRKKLTNESILSRLYLENIINEKQIKEIFELYNKEEFIDLQSSVYKDLISEIFEINQDEFIKDVKKCLITLNEMIVKNFEIEKEKNENLLQDKIYKELYSIEKLENKINIIYSNGLNNIDINSKNIIYGYLNETLNKIKIIIDNEIFRLSNELTSYSNNYGKIESTLNNLKLSIYNKFYKVVCSINNEFYSQIYKKFYNDYIEKYLNEYQNIVKAAKFNQFKFLNISINLKNIISSNIETFVNEYKYLTVKYINYLNQKYLQELDNIFSFSNFQNIINNEIDNMYNSKLLPILKEKAIYYSGDNKVLDYDFNNTVLADINSFIEDKIKITQQIINKLKGKKYELEKDWIIPNFYSFQSEELLYIGNSFNNFTEVYSEIEQNEFNEAILESLTKNLKIKVENIIPSFGKDFFERIIKFNEIQRIQSLFKTLKYSLSQTINYYIKLFSMNTSNTIPEDLKNKILSLNKIDLLITSFKNEKMSKLDNLLTNLFDETKDFIVDKYIYYIKVDPSVKLALDNGIKTIIDDLIDDNREIFENAYNDIININIKNWFIEKYNKILNEEYNNIINFIEEEKKKIKIKIDSLNILNIDYILLGIENKYNNILSSINNFNKYFSSFEISEEIPNLLNNYCREKILPIYNEIKFELDKSTKDIVVKNIDRNINSFMNKYNHNNFESKSKNISINYENIYFKNMINYLKYSYGAIDSIYLSNLNKDINNFKNIRNLDDLDNDNKRNIAYIQLDEILKLLKNSSLSYIAYITNLKYFSDFKEKINKYKSEISEQYTFSKINIQKMNYEESINKKLIEQLDNLVNYINNYYIKVNSSFYQTKELIENNIIQINSLIEKCASITYNQINSKYLEIKNKYNPVNKKIKKEKSIEIENHIEKVNDMSYIIKTKMDKYFIDNEISLDIILEQGDIIIPKIKSKIINKNHPKKIVIDFYANYGQICEIKGRKITINFNNISLISDFIFDSSLNNITINKSIEFEQYNIKNEKYTIKEENFKRIIDGITFVIPTLCISTLDGENEIEIVETIKNSSIEI